MKSLLLVLALIGIVAAQWPRHESQDDVDVAYQRFLIMQRLRMRMEAEREAARAEKEVEEAESRASTAMIKKKCDEYGHSGAFEDFEGVGTGKSCVQDAVKDAPSNIYGIRQGIRYGCSVAPRLGRCLVNLGEAVKPCLPPQRRQNFQLANVTHELISYACDNDGARVHNFLFNDGPECLKNNVDELRECADKFDTKEVVNSLENSIESGEVTDSQCKQSTELRKCMEGKLSTCSNPSALFFFKGIMDIAEKYSPCSSKQVMPERMFSVQQTV